MLEMSRGGIAPPIFVTQILLGMQDLGWKCKHYGDVQSPETHLVSKNPSAQPMQPARKKSR